MRKFSTIAGFALSSMLFTGSAFAQDPAATPPAPPIGEAAPPAAAPKEAAAPAAAGDDKKMGLGLDLQFMMPVGDLADATGPQIGPMLRFGYRVMPPMELTLRAGYLFGLGKELAPGAKTSMSNIPILLGARYFFMEPQAGLYGGAELGANMLKVGTDPEIPAGPIADEVYKMRTRFGFNLGVGYVISKDLPIDIRAQYSYLNLLGAESGEKSLMGIGLSAGYTLSF